MDNKKLVLIIAGAVVGLGLLVLVCAGLVGVVMFARSSAAAKPRPPATQVATRPPATKAGSTAASKAPATSATKPPPVEPLPPNFVRDRVPTNDELRQLTTATILAFNGARNAKDLRVLQKHMSSLHQGPDGLRDIETNLKGFLESAGDLSGVKNAAPVFMPPPKIENGLLIVEGHYPSEPVKVTFRFSYAFEDNTWKLQNYKIGTSGQS